MTLFITRTEPLQPQRDVARTVRVYQLRQIRGTDRPWRRIYHQMKSNLNCEVLVDCHQNPQGLMEYREQVVVFRKDGINHIARNNNYVYIIPKGKKPKLISLLTNDFDMPLNNRSDIPPPLADRVSFQADQAELPSEIFLRRKCQRHQNPDMGSRSSPICYSRSCKHLEQALSFGLATIVRIVLMWYSLISKSLSISLMRT